MSELIGFGQQVASTATKSKTGKWIIVFIAILAVLFFLGVVAGSLRLIIMSLSLTLFLAFFKMRTNLTNKIVILLVAVGLLFLSLM